MDKFTLANVVTLFQIVNLVIEMALLAIPARVSTTKPIMEIVKFASHVVNGLMSVKSALNKMDASGAKADTQKLGVTAGKTCGEK